MERGAAQPDLEHAAGAFDHPRRDAPAERQRNGRGGYGMAEDALHRRRPPQGVDHYRGAPDRREDPADERVDGRRARERHALDRDGRERRCRSGRRGGGQGHEPERVGHRVLRHVPQASGQAVDPVPLEVPGGDCVDVGVLQLGEPLPAVPQAVDFVRPLEAAGQQDEGDGCGHSHRPAGGCPRQHEHRRHEEQAGEHGVDLEAGLHVADRRRPGLGHRCGQQEVGPVVVDGFRRQVRVARRRRELRQLRGQRHVPDEVGGEVGAVAVVALIVPLADPGERRHRQRQRQGEHGGEPGARAPVPLRQHDERFDSPPAQSPGHAAGDEPHGRE